MTNAAPSLIAADWGTTNFRMFLFGADGQIIARHTANIGLKNLGSLTFEQALTSVMTGAFARPDLPVLLSGMVGSRQGWIEAPYAACPSALKDISAQIVTAPSENLRVSIVPGLSAQDAKTQIFNVMRGEETQIFGLMHASKRDGVYILPGTHSKSAVVEDGVVKTFTSYMTGEMFSVLKSHSILGALMANDKDDEAAFLLGVERALDDASLLSLLFSARTEALFSHLAPESLSSYLSGLLIGSEVRGEIARHGILPVGLIGDGALSNLYQRALSHAGFTDVTQHDGDTASSTGLWAIAQQGQLL